MASRDLPSTTRVELNGTTYALPPRPVVAICLDGCADEYLDEALLQGRMPRTHSMLAQGGTRLRARGALPSFTNVNNASIVCGATPAVTGIAGNFFLDAETGQEVMMNSPEFLRCETLLAHAERAGRRVAMVTAKDKLRRFLTGGMESGIAFSAEKAAEVSREENGIEDVLGLVDAPAPDVYSGELSLFALRTGATLLERGLADFLYLTTSDYIQHKHACDEAEALEFYAEVDKVIGRCLDAGAVIGLTADHGMSAKSDEDTIYIVWLEQELRAAFGAGVRVTCTITDPYVVHHGALGGFVVVHVEEGLDAHAVAEHARRIEGVSEVHLRAEAARLLELPADRLGDIVVLSDRGHAIGRSPQDHDLSLLDGMLRTHGGRYEEMVPLLLSRPLAAEHRAEARRDPRNFDLFRFLCAEPS